MAQTQFEIRQFTVPMFNQASKKLREDNTRYRRRTVAVRVPGRGVLRPMIDRCYTLEQIVRLTVTRTRDTSGEA
jgi:hypothetical protein